MSEILTGEELALWVKKANMDGNCNQELYVKAVATLQAVIEKADKVAHKNVVLGRHLKEGREYLALVNEYREALEAK